jgi:hypothetical protein
MGFKVDISGFTNGYSNSLKYNQQFILSIMSINLISYVEALEALLL